MNKEQFLKELKAKLRYLPETDRQDAIRFYDEYISEMELPDDEDVTAKLGTPKEVAADIISQCTIKHIDNNKEQKSVKGSATTVWLIILGILSLPLSLPIAIAILAIMFSLVVVIFSCFISGFAAILWSIFVPGVTQKIFSLGYGLFAVGFNILLGYAFVALLKKMFRSFNSRKRARVA